MNMEAVGLFSRAASLNRYFATALCGIIGPVMLPWLSQLNRDGACLCDIYEPSMQPMDAHVPQIVKLVAGRFVAWLAML